jgi:serine/threonine protein kinase
MNNILINENDITNSLSKSAKQIKSYAGILDEYKLGYSDAKNYWQVGEINQTQGWILHLSVIRQQVEPLLEILVPLLIKENVAFKIIKDSDVAKYILDGNLGYAQIGKVVCVFPKDDNEALFIAKVIIQNTQSFRGPDIPTNIQLKGIVYARYGSFNPIIKTKEDGTEVRYIYNAKEELVPDFYSIPFVVPEGISWPFNEIASPIIPMPSKLLNKRYKPLIIIKPDAKGRVIRGLYMNGFLNIKKCIIKEGKRNMWVDEQGRDIQDRLQWQYDLCNDIQNDIPVPKIFEIFRENNATYLAMEFVKGDSLEDILLNIYQGNSWPELSQENKLLLISHLLKIITIIQKLHERGYVHRDITTNNFLIDKKGRIFLIDLELSYSLLHTKPSPPFKLGTFGFISPEQDLQKIPTVKEDIYAIGALMAFIFSGLPPVKFSTRSIVKNKNALLFFTESESISDIISKCLVPTPDQRPQLEEIKEIVTQYQKEITNHKFNKEVTRPYKNTEIDLKNLIEAAIQGLANKKVLTQEYLWESQVYMEDSWIGNEQIKKEHLGGIHVGMAGILYTLALAETNGYNIDSCMQAYTSGWKYLESSFLEQISSTKRGFYEGTTGIALAISEGLNAGLLSPTSLYENYLNSCFESLPYEGLDIESGIAGKGIALLQCSRWLKPELVQSLLTQYIDIVIENQQTDGSWDLYRMTKKGKGKITGLSGGIAGITLFLLAYANRVNDIKVTNAIRKALEWLIKNFNREKGLYFWRVTTKNGSISPWSVDIGTPGIAFLFIKAYEHFKDPQYKDIAERALRNLSSTPVKVDLTQAFGMAGLGEIYMEAYKVFKTEEWKERANWIKNIMIHTTLLSSDGSAYWSMNAYPNPVPDLMTGSSGIIHFLMRIQNPDKLGHPLLDIDNN